MIKRAERAEQEDEADQSVLSRRWLRHRRADLVAFNPRGTDQITPLVAKHSFKAFTQFEGWRERERSTWGRRRHLNLRRLVDGVSNVVVVDCVGRDPRVCEGLRPHVVKSRLVSRGHEHAFDIRNDVLEPVGDQGLPLLLAERLPHHVFLGPLARPLMTWWHEACRGGGRWCGGN